MPAMKLHRGLALLLFVYPLPSSAAPEPACAEQVETLTKWLDLAKADKTRGAILAGRVEKLVATPIRAAEPPKEPMMTLVVHKIGVSEKPGAVSAIENTKSVIESNINYGFAKQNSNAIARGILVGGENDAPAASVRKVLAAASASGEKVWLLFRPSDAKIAAPPKSKVADELAKIDSTEMMKIVEIIRREFGPCEGLIGMMGKMGGQTMATRLDTIINTPPVALKECKCKTPGANIAAVLWSIAFRELAVAIPVPAAKLETLPWGDAKASWSSVAPGIVKAL
jgi:hypothetical protein